MMPVPGVRDNPGPDGLRAVSTSPFLRRSAGPQTCARPGGEPASARSSTAQSSTRQSPPSGHGAPTTLQRASASGGGSYGAEPVSQHVRVRAAEQSVAGQIAALAGVADPVDVRVELERVGLERADVEFILIPSLSASGPGGTTGTTSFPHAVGGVVAGGRRRPEPRRSAPREAAGS